MGDSQHNLHKIDNDIFLFQNVILTLPRVNPMRIGCVQALALARFERYKLSSQEYDLEQSILYHTEAIFLPLPWDRRCRNIVQMFFSTTQALLHRANKSRHPEDVERTIIHLRYLHSQYIGPFNVLTISVTIMLVDALSIRAELELGDVMEVIEEMAILCLEILQSHISSPLGSIMALVQAVKAQFGRWSERQEPSSKVIDCLREANTRFSDSDEISITLAWSLFNRFHITYSNDDYEEGTAIVDKIITSRAPGDRLNQYQEIALRLISSFAQARFTAYGKPECLEDAIYRLRTLLRGISLEDPIRPTVIYALTLFHGTRFREFGVTEGHQDEHSSNSGFFGHPSFRELTTALSWSNSSESPPMATENQHLDALLSIDGITDIAEIEEAVKYCRILLASRPGEVFTRLASIGLSTLLLRAFSYTNDIEYLNEEISTLQDALNMPGVETFTVIRGLISSLSTRFDLLRYREDLGEIMRLFPMAANHKYASIPERFQVSCQWALYARSLSHPCTSTAYGCAVSLMQDTLTFAPTVDIQHFRLIAMRESYETLPLDSASYQVHTGQLQRAIETLERGRALIWSEMRGLRSSIDQLHASDSQLADKFTALNRDLEMLTLTLSPNYHGGAIGSDDHGPEGMDPFGRLVVRQQQLLEDREMLISQIRSREGLETFLKAPSFDDLRSAAVRGPVIIVNHCRWRSDIVILLRGSLTPSLIPTTDDFYDRANKLRDRLLGARKKGLDSKEYEDTLGSVLKDLYELVGRPVIQRLNELHVPEQSRVWWCPTSAFCSLPLHAMGPIPSDMGGLRYFMDLYIPSYTPTLSALIGSNKPGTQTSGKPSILLVLQPDASMEDALDEMKVVQSVDAQVTTLISAKATPTAVLERLRDHRFAHIVCHGELETGKPFESSFKLYRGKRLSLLDIIRSRLPDGEFAFLAACHTAELTDGSLSDEALHLTAAMQYCGFRSVVGTMWAMADTDGRDLAENFYKSVFSGGRRGTRYYKRTAKALRDAVIKLRRRKGREMTLERWVNFVHYGA